MSRHWLPIIGVILWFGQAALGQAELERFERQLEQIQRDTRLHIDQNIPAEQRALIDYGGYATINFLTIDTVDFDDAQGKWDRHSHLLWQTDLNGYARANIDGVHEFFLRARASYRDFNDGDSFDGSGDDLVGPTLDRGTYRFDLQRAFQAYHDKTIPGNVVVQAGRQLVLWANGLVLSEDIDGAVATFSYEKLSLEVLAGITRQSDTDFDPSRPGFDSKMRRGFYGGMLALQVTPEHKPYIYGLVQEDYNPDEVVDGAHFKYDSYYVGAGATGALSDRILYAAEIVYEGGETLSTSRDANNNAIAQTLDPISAYAADFRLDYLFTDTNRSRLTAEFILASGDSDRTFTNTTIGGNKPNTTDHAFNAFGLLNTGLAFAPNVSNILVVRGGASTFPLPETRLFGRLQVGMDLLYFSKLNASAPIDEKTDDAAYLGFETDLYANWQITSDVSLAVRYGIFFPGDAMPSERVRNFVYTGLTVAF